MDDVGAAMADYVRHGRSTSQSQLLFVSVRALFAGLSSDSIDRADEPYIRQITGLTVDRLVVVPGRIVNVVPR
jgi:hypothetical protein